jgi:hypothetical protein
MFKDNKMLPNLKKKLPNSINQTEKKNRKWNLPFKSINKAINLKIKSKIKTSNQSTEAFANVAKEILNSWDTVQNALKV